MTSFLVLWSPTALDTTVGQVKAIDAFAVEGETVPATIATARDHARASFPRYLAEHGEGRVEVVPHLPENTFLL